MAHHFGGGFDGFNAYPPPAMPTPVTVSPIPAGYDDAEHLNGFRLDPPDRMTWDSGRATWRIASGDLAKLLSARR